MIDPTGFILTTIRDDATVAGLTTRVRGAQPMPRTYDATGALLDAGDARESGAYVRFVVLSRLGYQRQKRIGMQEVRWSARCYGAGGNPAQDASALAGAVSDSIHALGPRISSGGVGVFASFDDGGEGAGEDPFTSQPYESVVIQAVAADRPIA